MHTLAQLEKKARRLGQSSEEEVNNSGGGVGGVLPCRHHRGPESDTPDWASPAGMSSEAKKTRKRETHKRLRVETFRGHFAPHRDCLAAILALGSLGSTPPPLPVAADGCAGISIRRIHHSTLAHSHRIDTLSAPYQSPSFSQFPLHHSAPLTD